MCENNFPTINDAAAVVTAIVISGMKPTMTRNKNESARPASC